MRACTSAFMRDYMDVCTYGGGRGRQQIESDGGADAAARSPSEGRTVVRATAAAWLLQRAGLRERGPYGNALRRNKTLPVFCVFFLEPHTTTTPGSALTRQSRVPSPGTPSTRRRGKREGCAADRPGAPDEDAEKRGKVDEGKSTPPKTPSTGMGRGKLSRIFFQGLFRRGRRRREAPGATKGRLHSNGVFRKILACNGCAF